MRILACMILILLLTACSRSSENIPFPYDKSEGIKPVTLSLQFSEPVHSKWDSMSLHRENFMNNFTSRLNAIPEQSFSADGFFPLQHQPEQQKFDILSFESIPFLKDSLIFQPLSSSYTILPPPKMVRAGIPTLNENGSAGILKMDENQGLPQGIVSAMLTDSKGMLWLAPESGLCRFNGEYLEIFSFIKRIFNGGIASVSDMLEDRMGRIWIRTNLDGMYILDQDLTHVRHFELPPDYNLLSDLDMAEDHEGRIWLASMNGLFIVDPENWTIAPLKKNIPLAISRVIRDKKGNIWAGAMQGILFIDFANNKQYHIRQSAGLLADTIFGLHCDAENRIWIAGMRNRISIIIPDSGLIRHLELPSTGRSFINQFAEDSQHRLWMSTTDGILIYNPSGNIYRRITVSEGLSDKSVKYIHTDRHGQVWMGTYDGLNILDASGIMPVHHTNPLIMPITDVWSVEEGLNKELWVGGRQGSIIYYPEKRQYRNLNDLLPFNFMAGLSTLFRRSKDSSMLIWLPDQGIMNVDFNTDQIVRLNLTFPEAGNMNSLIEDSEGRIWCGGFTNGVYTIDRRTGKLFRITREKGLMGKIIWNLLEDDQGLIWVVTDSAVNILDPKNQSIRHVMLNEIRSASGYHSALKDQYGNIWIGTEKGILFVNKKKREITEVSLFEDFGVTGVFSMLNVDDLIYAGTGQGLVIFQKDDSNESFPWRQYHYGKLQGLPDLDFNGTSAAYSDNKIWWGIEFRSLSVFMKPKTDSLAPGVNISGLSIMDQTVQFHYHDSATVITNKQDQQLGGSPFLSVHESSPGLKLNELSWDSLAGKYYLPSNLEVPFRYNFLSFRFTANEFINRDKIRYCYILDGLDKKWSRVTTNAFTDMYRDLPPGTYNFKVSAAGMNGIWSAPASFTFTILPPWWRTWWAYMLYAGLLFLVIRSIVLYRSRWLKKENIRLETMVTHRTEELKNSLKKLSSAQAQLIQSEKMASLGELTAGIAHEIQNPLNFVNNFSEVNNELIDEMRSELTNGNTAEALTVAEDIRQNNEKISFHGKRAESIVRNMLQHSRSSRGQSELTDINALCDEYLRLAYQGMRAKDKNINVTLETYFDEAIGQIHVVPQDIGRVLLNIYNNALYAVTEKKKTSPAGYEPLVSVTTRRNGDNTVIMVKDNGPGIPGHSIEKIFQPFFTTKPTGQGTGLGLSLSYDIIKAHGGEIRVENLPGSGVVFFITIP